MGYVEGLDVEMVACAQMCATHVGSGLGVVSFGMLNTCVVETVGCGQEANCVRMTPLSKALARTKIGGHPICLHRHRPTVLMKMEHLVQAEREASAVLKALMKRLAKVTKQRHKKMAEVATIRATGTEILALIADSEARLTQAHYAREDYEPPRTSQRARKSTGGKSPAERRGRADKHVQAHAKAHARAAEEVDAAVARQDRDDAWHLHFV